MADEARETDGLDVSKLLTEIASDSVTLVGQQLKLIQSEIREEVAKTGLAAVLLGAGAGLIAGGGLLSSVALVHLLHQRTRLPLWASYGLVAGASTSVGLHCWFRGSRMISEVQQEALPQTRESLQENLTWLRDQVTPSAP